MDNEDIDLTFRVPNEDFDAITVEVALIGIEKTLKDLPPLTLRCIPNEYSHLLSAYRVLHIIHTRYMDTTGHPEWKREFINFMGAK